MYTPRHFVTPDLFRRANLPSGCEAAQDESVSIVARMFPRLLKRRHASTRSSTTMPNRFRIASTSSSVFCLPHALVMDVNKRSDCLGQRKRSRASLSVATRRCRRRAAPCAAFSRVRACAVSGPPRYFKIYNSSFQFSCQVKLKLAPCQVSRTPRGVVFATSVAKLGCAFSPPREETNTSSRGSGDGGT